MQISLCAHTEIFNIFLIFLTEMKSFRSRVDRAKGDASEKILVKVQNAKDISYICRKSSKF